jgi:UDP-N-acetylglucosamine:LPS N-acetylglucosamine transferase
VGGTATGLPLLERTLQAWPHIRIARPDAQLVVVAGPRIDPARLHEHADALLPYVHNLHEHLACADLGIVQGGLSTTIGLTIARRPFLFFPLQGHCEQVYHVAHRLGRYGAGRRMDYAETGAEELAAVALATLGADTSFYRAHTPGGAARAAGWIAELL